MTDREINRLIAEACPTVAVVCSDGELRWNYKLRPVPTCFDPVNDLNAMHKAEKGLTHEQWRMYSVHLATECGATWIVNSMQSSGVRAMTSATARQRAEAFLRTLGKWPVTAQAALDKSPPA